MSNVIKTEAQKKEQLEIMKLFLETQLLCNQFNHVNAQHAAAQNKPLMLAVVPQSLFPEGFAVIPAPMNGHADVANVEKEKAITEIQPDEDDVSSSS